MVTKAHLFPVAEIGLELGMVLGEDMGVFFFWQGRETEQTALIPHVRPHLNGHLSLCVSPKQL